MIWKKKDSCNSVKEVVERNTGMSVHDLLNPERLPYLTNLDKCADRILLAVQNRERITIIGDYDVDGITSSSILFLLLKHLGVTPRVRLPRRFSEGYGMSKAMVDEIDSGLLITVDNGIACMEEIQRAKEKGLSVIIIDHHLSDVVPDADIVLDPHVVAHDTFIHYCGAGLSYRVSLAVLQRCVPSPEQNRLLELLKGFAAIGTIADVMPLVGDNRHIVIEGMKAINDGYVTSGMRALLQSLKLSCVDEETIGFQLAPVMNAAGRLRDTGAMTVFKLIASESSDENKLTDVAMQLITLNNERKALVSEALEKAEAMIKDRNMDKDPAFILKINDLNEGIVGIVAGKLCETYQRPCIILTGSSQDGILKGSGRSPAGVHLKKLLDACAECLERYGGHAGAAGLSIAEDKVSLFVSSFLSAVRSLSLPAQYDVAYYDLEVAPKDVNSVYEEIKKYGPYGEGNAPIVVKICDFELKERFGSRYKAVGSDHIKLFGKHNDAIGFGLYEKFMSVSDQDSWNLIASMGENTYNGKTSVQIQFRDIV